MSRSEQQPPPEPADAQAKGRPPGRVSDDLTRVFGGWGVEGEGGPEAEAATAEAAEDGVDAESEPAAAPEMDEAESVFQALAGAPEDGTVEGGEAAAAEPFDDTLAELRAAVTDLAQRPPVDLKPLVDVMQQSLAASSAANTALTAVASELREFTHRVDTTPTGPGGVPRYLVARERRTGSAMLAIAFLVACWALVLWVRTGNEQLAIGTLAVAVLMASGVFVSRG